MSISRKVASLATLAFVALASAASPTFAQTEPELHNQTPRLLVAQEVHAANDIACPAVMPSPPPALSPITASGGCRLHMASVGQVTLTIHAAAGIETIASACTVEFDVRIDAAGEGWILHQEYFGDAGCTRVPCGQAAPGEARAFTFHMSEVEPPARTEQAVILFCHQLPSQPENPEHCEVTLPLSQPATHRYRLTANDAAGHGGSLPRCEISGTFDVEAVLGTSGEALPEQNVEIRHT